MNLSGIYPPIATPFTDGEVDYAGLAHNARRWMATGLRGLLALGSNGEAAFVDEDEAERIVATVREGVPRDRVLLVGTGRQSTRATIAATARAAKAGADAVLVLTPFYFKSQMTHDALVEHYRAVADASPVPVLLYNFTNVTGPEHGARHGGRALGASEHRRHQGLERRRRPGGGIVARVPAEFTVLVGSAATLYPSLVVGAARRHCRRGQRRARGVREALRPGARREARRGPARCSAASRRWRAAVTGGFGIPA